MQEFYQINKDELTTSECEQLVHIAHHLRLEVVIAFKDLMTPSREAVNSLIVGEQVLPHFTILH